MVIELSSNMVIRPINPMDYLALYDMLKRRPAVAGISHKEMPTFNEHLKFIESKPYKYWGVIVDVEGRLGNVYLTHQNEIGVFIDEEYTGAGIGGRVVRALMDRFGPGRFLANIAPGNYGSKKFFERLGFKKIQETYELEC